MNRSRQLDIPFAAFSQNLFPLDHQLYYPRSSIPSMPKSVTYLLSLSLARVQLQRRLVAYLLLSFRNPTLLNVARLQHLIPPLEAIER